MKEHIKDKRKEYVELFKRAKKLGVSWADFRYHTVHEANESAYRLEKSGNRVEWADVCLKAAQEFVYYAEQCEAEHEVEIEYEKFLENQG